MAYEADIVAVELLAKVDGFDGRIKQSAASFGGDMKRIEGSATNAERTVGRSLANVDRSLQRTSQQSRLLGYQISDIGVQLSAGTSPFLVLAQQGPQVANALEGAKGAVGRFAGFLSGPWGAALLAATTMLGVFISKTGESEKSVDDLVKKLKDKARQDELNQRALEAYNRTIDGHIQKQKELTETLAEQLKTQRDLNIERLQAAQTSASTLQVDAKALEAEIKRAEEAAKRARDRVLNPNPADAEIMPQLAIAANKAAERVKELKAQLEQVKQAAADAQEAIRRAQVPLLDEAADAKVDKAKQAVLEFTDALKKLRNEYISGRIAEAEYIKQKAALEKKLKAAEEAARKERSTKTTDTGDATKFISPVVGGRVTGSFGEGRGNRNHAGIDIAVPVGTNVRAPAGGVIIEAGTLPGYGNVVYIDHGRGTISRLAHLSKISVAKGDIVNQGDLVGLSGGAKGAPGSGNSRGPHLHQEVRVNGRAVDPRKGPFPTDAGSVYDTSERAREAEERRRQAYENELASLMSGEIEARRALVESAEAIAKLELESIELARQKYNDNADSLVQQGKLLADEADELKKVNDERAKLRAELVQRRDDQRKFRVREAEEEQRLRFAADRRGVDEELLESRADLAKTAKQRRDLESRLIDIAFDEERIQLQAVIAAAERLKIEMERIQTLRDLSDAEKLELQRALDRADVARDRLGTLDERRGNAQQGNRERTRGPLEEYFGRIPSDMDEINEALENVAAGGLATFTDALTDALVNFRSLKEVGLATLQAITAALVKMAIQQIILKTIGQSAGNAAVATSAAQAAATGAAWAGPAAMVSLATLGANAVPASAALTATTALATALGAVPRKDGGPIFGPGGPRDDKVLMAASPGEYVIQAKSASKLGRATLDRLNLTGELPTRDDGGPIGLGPINRPAASSNGPSGLDEASLRRLEAAVERGAAAQRPVNLYPTMEPAKAMEAMLSDPGGQRAFFRFMSENSSKFRSQINQ